MSKKTSMKPIALAISAAFASTIAASSIANADTSVFSMSNLTTGYMLDEHAKKGEEGKCGEKKGEEGKCGEGKCGGDKAKEKGEEGKCGGHG